jgi:hypothetical protein
MNHANLKLVSILGDNANALGQLMIEDIRNFGKDTMDEQIVVVAVVVASSKHSLFANLPRKLQSIWQRKKTIQYA